MSRIDTKFTQLQSQNRKALVPFVTAGDPSLEATVPVMHALVAAGADLLELGVPFSDPMADGPVIQRSSERALARGAEAFARDAVAAGVDGVLLVDLPMEEAGAHRAIFDAAGLALVPLASPTTSPERMAASLEHARGYLYYVNLAGVTGSSVLDAAVVGRRLDALREGARVPVMAGFGIRDAADAAAVGAHADGIVVGSALVAAMEEADDVAGATARAREFLAPLRAALDAA
jgi:tryptophan synthase alpha chain